MLFNADEIHKVECWLAKSDVAGSSPAVRSMNLFQQGSFILHSGSTSGWKIDCDALTNDDWETLALMISEKCRFGNVIGIPRGGIKLAKALEQYVTEGETLIVDDVLTTGGSMEKERQQCSGTPIGFVVFARNECPDWISTLFQME